MLSLANEWLILTCEHCKEPRDRIQLKVRERKNIHSCTKAIFTWVTMWLIWINSKGPFIIPNKTPQRLLNSSEETCICNSGLCFTAYCETRGRAWECNEQPTSPCLSAVSLQHLFQHCLFSHGSARLRLGRMYNPFQQLIGGSASEGFREKWEDERETGFGLAKSAPCWEELHLWLRLTAAKHDSMAAEESK